MPNLFANDEWEKIIGACRKPCEEAGITPTKDNIKAFFVSRVRSNLHVVLCMSPVGRWALLLPLTNHGQPYPYPYPYS